MNHPPQCQWPPTRRQDHRVALLISILLTTLAAVFIIGLLVGTPGCNAVGTHPTKQVLNTKEVFATTVQGLADYRRAGKITDSEYVTIDDIIQTTRAQIDEAQQRANDIRDLEQRQAKGEDVSILLEERRKEWNDYNTLATAGMNALTDWLVRAKGRK